MKLEFEISQVYANTEHDDERYHYCIVGLLRQGLFKGLLDLDGEYTELLKEGKTISIEVHP